MRSRLSRHRSVALWLALVAMLLRGLLPDAMALGSGMDAAASALPWCHGAQQAQALEAQRGPQQPSHDAMGHHCICVVSAVPALLQSGSHDLLDRRLRAEAPAILPHWVSVAAVPRRAVARGPPIHS